MNGETSVDHLQRETDRPVPNEQHRESHSLKWRLIEWLYLGRNAKLCVLHNTYDSLALPPAVRSCGWLYCMQKI